ncbi:transforming acidic coiled-coil-containing protein 1 short isoform [Cricetulus griseus]|nr:transforming acidic coiled-coil-containing protein 1 short isoform [Cricetulus griseus]
MAFSPWQILSPVQWAKWTWSAVRGVGAGEEEAGGPEGDPEEEEDSQAETKSLSFRQVHRIPAEMQARAILLPRSCCVRATTVFPALLRLAPCRVPAVHPKVRDVLSARVLFVPCLRCELSEPSPESAVSASRFAWLASSER